MALAKKAKEGGQPKRRATMRSRDKVIELIEATGMNPDGVVKDMKRGDNCHMIVSLKKFLEGKEGRKISFMELDGFCEAFRGRYKSFLKKGLVGDAEELVENFGEGIDLTEETAEALVFCMEKNDIDTFCRIIADKLALKVDMDEAIENSIGRQTKKLMTRMVEFISRCGISVQPESIQEAVNEAAEDWTKGDME